MILIDKVIILFYSLIVDPITYIFIIIFIIKLFTYIIASLYIILLNAIKTSPCHNSHQEGPTSWSTICHENRCNNLQLRTNTFNVTPVVAAIAIDLIGLHLRVLLNTSTPYFNQYKNWSSTSQRSLFRCSWSNNCCQMKMMALLRCQ